MLKKLSYIFILLSVGITIGHSAVAHHHDFEDEATEHHHHHDSDDHHDHSIFSFGQLDENFIFSKSNITLSNDVSTALFLVPINPILVTINFSIGRTDFITHQEFPPPEDYFHSASHRGPPTV